MHHLGTPGYKHHGQASYRNQLPHLRSTRYSDRRIHTTNLQPNTCPYFIHCMHITGSWSFHQTSHRHPFRSTCITVMTPTMGCPAIHLSAFSTDNWGPRNLIPATPECKFFRNTCTWRVTACFMLKTTLPAVSTKYLDICHARRIRLQYFAFQYVAVPVKAAR